MADDLTITGYALRHKDGKKKAVLALQQLNYEVIAMGDSYNDIRMLQTAEHGILFRPPKSVVAEFPELPITHHYNEIRAVLEPLL